jgi:hypothetical protein
VRVRFLFAAMLVGIVARADEPQATVEDQDPATVFREATDALAGERPTDAITKLESLSDKGVVDAVASFDRGLAYARRVRAGAGAEQAGDLGRAAHGFEEARELTRDPALADEATRALVAVRAEVARRRARSGEPVDLEHGVSLGRSIVGLLPENVWALLAIALTCVLTIAIVVRSRVTLARAKVAATTTCAVSGALLALTALCAWAARDARLNLREGVVVAPNARLLDERHVVRDAVAPIAEATRVRIIDEGGGYSRVSVAGNEGWLASSAVLPIAKR